jgi:hypothetical protein
VLFFKQWLTLVRAYYAIFLIFVVLTTRRLEKVLNILDDFSIMPNHQAAIRLRIQLAQLWLGWCREKHRTCKTWANDDTKLPSRILDVSPSNGSSEPVLLETSGERAPYMTLSYRWGEQKSYRQRNPL